MSSRVLAVVDDDAVDPKLDGVVPTVHTESEAESELEDGEIDCVLYAGALSEYRSFRRTVERRWPEVSVFRFGDIDVEFTRGGSPLVVSAPPIDEPPSIETVLDSTPDVFFLIDDDGRLAFWNRTLVERSGYFPERLDRMETIELIAEADRATMADFVGEGLSTDDPVSCEVDLLTAEGETIPHAFSAHRVTARNGVVGLAGTARDVSKLINRESVFRKLQETTCRLIQADDPEEVCRLSVETAEDALSMQYVGLFTHDADANVFRPVEWTDGATALLGEDPTIPTEDSIAGEVFRSEEGRIHPGIDDTTSFGDDESIQHEIVVSVGDWGVLIAGSTARNRFDSVDLTFAEVLASATEAAIQNAARSSELERYRTAVEAVPDAVYLLNEEGYIEMVSYDALTDLTGYTTEQLRGMHFGELLDPEAVSRNTELVKELLTTDSQKVIDTFDIVGADGRRVPVENHMSTIQDDDGKLQGVTGVIRDISDRKRREQELKRQNERLEEFAGVVSHDLRNPLNVAEGYIEHVQQGGDVASLQKARSALERMDDLIDDLLALAQQGRAVDDPEAVSLRSVTERAWANVEVENGSLSVTDSELTADPGRLQQLLENLLSNAVEHGSVDEETAEDGSRRSTREADDGTGVTIHVGPIEDGFYVEDDGPGIDEDEREAVFEQGYTTGDSTGYGLAIVRNIAEAHGWATRIVDGTDGGARFEFTGVEPPG